MKPATTSFGFSSIATEVSVASEGLVFLTDLNGSRYVTEHFCCGSPRMSRKSSLCTPAPVLFTIQKQTGLTVF